MADPRHRSPLQGALNFRDLGGLPAAGGLVTRHGLLFRSDTLQMLTGDDVEHLAGGLALAAVLDLRLAREVEEEGRGLLAARSGIAYANTPLAMASTEGLLPDQVLRALYVGCLAPGSMLPRAVGHLVSMAGQPTVFHCAAGKDRTGIVAAVVLRLLGVADEAIVADYLGSALNMPAMLDRFASMPRYRDHLATMPPQVYAVDEDPLRAFLAELDRQHGGARAWALAHGIEAAALDRWAQAMLRPA